MKADELMIGDRIYAVDDDTDFKIPIIVNGIDSIGNINAVIPDYNGQMVDGNISFECCEPISITPEILEKNFEKREVRILAGTKTHYCLGDDYFALAVSEYTDGIWEVEYTNCEAHFPLIRNLVGYVHELQHALRLCGIEKEITI